jgi:hypothetical protein
MPAIRIGVKHVLLGAALAASGCGGGNSTATGAAVPALLTSATIKDIMDSMVDPSADYLFESVAIIGDEHGVTERAPHTDEEWLEVRRRAVQLLEAPNLLVMHGRTVARPEDTSKNPNIELEPPQVQALIDADRPAFVTRARALQDAATVALKAIDAKDKDALFQASEGIDRACENCHLRYWYPNDERAQAAAAARDAAK